MNDLEVLEDRLRDALARRAAATTRQEPRLVPPPAASTELASPHRRRTWALQVAAALVVVAGVAGAVVLALPGGETGDGTGTTDSTAGSPRDGATGADGRLIEYQPTALPEGYQDITLGQPGVDDGAGMGSPRVGTNCLEWHLDGPTVVCDRFLAQLTRHYGQPGTERAVTVATMVNVPVDGIDMGEARQVEVQGQPAVLRPAGAGFTSRLVWEPGPDITVVLDARDPTVPDDEVLAVAGSLRPVEVAPPADMTLAVAAHDLPPDQVPEGGYDTAFLWARPGPEPCLGGSIGANGLRCYPHAEDDPLVSVGGGPNPVVGGAVSAAVEQVRIETLDGQSLDVPLLKPGGPFGDDRFFLVPLDLDRVTDVVALGPGGTELARNILVPRLP